jgi:hypothetical protein
MINITYIYLVENCFNDPNKVYIGKTKNPNSRKSAHKINFGSDIIFNIIDQVNSLDKQVWEPIETYWINQFKAWEFNVQNKNNGGGGPSYRSKELIEKQIQRQLGKKHSQETCNKRSQSMKKVWESKTDVVGYNKGKILSEETKNKMSKSAPKVRPYAYKKVIQYDLNGNVIKEHNSITEACLSVGKINRQGDITSVCRGKQKSAFGYIWKYKENLL